MLMVDEWNMRVEHW